MNKEIKIDGNSIQIGNKVCYCVDKDLIDYITNLQQENKRLQENNQSYQEEMGRTWKIADDYKLRYKKAIEYIDEHTLFVNGPIIKSILKGSDKNKFGFEQGKLIEYEEAQLLLDYITNLQQKYDKLQQEIKIEGNSIQIGNKVCYCVDKDLIDYIVKLQQENEKEKQFIKDCGFQNQQQLVLAYLDYKSRCEKAMELLKLPIVYETYQENGERDELLKKIRQAKDILNGSDENEIK